MSRDHSPGTSTLPSRLSRSSATEQSTRPTAPWTRYASLAGGLLGVALAGAGELLVESKSKSPVALILYLVGIAIFVVSAWTLPASGRGIAGAGGAGGRARTQGGFWLLLASGVLVSLALSAAAVFLLEKDLRSGPGAYLWLGSLLSILFAGWLASRGTGWSPRWDPETSPRGSRQMALVWAAAIGILAVASLARLVALDQVPLGINADEGDRAAVAIQIARGLNDQSIFDNGWYWISIMYFWLLGLLMKVIGIGYAQARVFGALASIASVAIVTWIGVRHFGVRVGLAAGALLAALGVSLQFARETSEAGPTATLWALSFAFLLEAARGGKLWAWAAAGLSGGMAIYFYPSGRLWAVVAAIYCVYLFIAAPGGSRRLLTAGIVTAAIAALMAVGPFLVHGTEIGADGVRIKETIYIRARETSIFTGDNPTRLNYYNRDWNTAQLLAAQVERTLGVFNQYHDEGGFWPTDRPIMNGLLTVLTLVGFGFCVARFRDPRYFLLATWFAVGLGGVVVTVETPNVQRLATAVPVMALLAALVLDSLALRLTWSLADRPRLALAARVAASAAVTALVALLMWQQLDNYFNVYGKTDRWPQPTIQGRAVADQGSETQVLTLGRQFHMVNSGWVRLMAPYAKRGGVRMPGIDLPLGGAPAAGIAMMVYPSQKEYLPYVQSLYPGGATRVYTHPTESTVVTVYQVAPAALVAAQGAWFQAGEQAATHVPSLGSLSPEAVPPGETLSWRAGLMVPKFWNYAFRVLGGSAKLSVDGRTILEQTGSSEPTVAAVSLAQGTHAVRLEAPPGATKGLRVEWSAVGAAVDATSNTAWQPVASSSLYSLGGDGLGLGAEVNLEDQPRKRTGERRIEYTLAGCCLSDQLDAGGRAYAVDWRGQLLAPVSGTYSMTLFTQGVAALTLDGKQVLISPATPDVRTAASVDLLAGPHEVQVTYRVENSPGAIEWSWVPPGGELSIVPPAALRAPAGFGVGEPLSQEELDGLRPSRFNEPFETVP